MKDMRQKRPERLGVRVFAFHMVVVWCTIPYHRASRNLSVVLCHYLSMLASRLYFVTGSVFSLH